METLKVKENFKVFGIAAIIYALIYVICMFDNGSGVAYPVFVTCTFVFIFFCMKKLGVKLRKGSYFYIVSIMLIAIATFCTDDGRIIFLNKIGVFLLTITFILHVTYDTQKWNFIKYITSILSVLCISMGEMLRPFEDVAWYVKNKMDKKNNKLLYLLAGIAFTIPLVAMVIGLLSSADAVFAEIFSKVFEFIFLGDMVLAFFMFAFMFMMTYCILCFMEKRNISTEVKETRNIEPFFAIPIVLVLSVVYIMFSVIQIGSLFMQKMQLPQGYTYASYAREGFFQLLLVSVLNLVIVLISLYCFKKNKFLKILLVIMSLCTFVMIASSATRMIIYIQYYYLTFLRIFVLWSLLALALVFGGVLISIVKEDFPIFRYSMIIVTVLYIGLSYSHPDYWIAKVNVAGMKENRSEFFLGERFSDYNFLSRLNADAAPILIDYMTEEEYDLKGFKENEEKFSNILYNQETFGYEYLRRMKDKSIDNYGRKYNVSRHFSNKY